MVVGYLISIIIIVIIALFLFWRLYFLRNPIRTTPKGNTIVSPADGKIVKILNTNNKNLKIKKGKLGKIFTDVKGYLIVIMMTPFDVHYQKAPLNGKILKTKHSKGTFVNAVLKAESLKALENEKNEIIIKTKIGKIKVIQIAGMVARRISCFVQKNQNIKKGENMGLINLGSQVCLIIPNKVKLGVVENQKVKAGETIIAKY